VQPESSCSPMSDVTHSAAQQRAFPQTRWSLVVAARRETSEESAAALETIGRDYWYPSGGGLPRRNAAADRSTCRSTPLSRRAAMPGIRQFLFGQRRRSSNNGRSLLLDVTIARVRKELGDAEHPERFEEMKTCLMAERGAIDYAAIAHGPRGGASFAEAVPPDLQGRDRADLVG
jgi:hypothetical protein